MEERDYAVLNEAETKVAVLEASLERVVIECSVQLFDLGFGRSSAGHGCPRPPAQHLLEIDEFLYLKEREILTSDFKPTSVTYKIYRHFRGMNYIPKPGLQFGCLFLLYTGAVDRVHAAFMVVYQRHQLLSVLEVARRMMKNVVWVEEQDGDVRSLLLRYI